MHHQNTKIMNKEKIIQNAGKIFIGFSALSLLSVSVLSLFDPAATMALVQVELGNNDALSSIRGVYGGVGISIVALLVHLYFTNPVLALRYLTLFWGLYALSRLITLLADGPLGDFGSRWIMIETVLFATGLLLIIAGTRNTKHERAQLY